MSEMDMIHLTSHIPVRALLKEFEKNGCKIPENAEQQLNQVLNILYARWSPQEEDLSDQSLGSSSGTMSKELRSVLGIKNQYSVHEDLRFLDGKKAMLFSKDSWWDPKREETGEATKEMIEVASYMTKGLGYPIDGEEIRALIYHKVAKRKGREITFILKDGEASATVLGSQEKLQASVPMAILSDYIQFFRRANNWKVLFLRREEKNVVLLHIGVAGILFYP